MCVFKKEQTRSFRAQDAMFETLREDLLKANDFDVHFAALCVFHELTARRLGGKMTVDSSGNAVVLVDSPTRKARAKTPKKIASKQDAINEMFIGETLVRLEVGQEVDLDVDGTVIHLTGGGIPATLDSQTSVSPDPPSEPRLIPKKATAKGSAVAKARSKSP